MKNEEGEGVVRGRGGEGGGRGMRGSPTKGSEEGGGQGMRKGREGEGVVRGRGGGRIIRGGGEMEVGEREV